ncbi:MAG: DUF799 domain-containing protein [Pseudomonadota bacterium]|uniref:DUF799 domain-containing protein n=1 Tax=Thermithiobacillus tepidarius TaxID=929 RepID=UPI0009DC0234|nr:GNA1162 family protein [Thermithiobacillus tepidarius]
MTTSAKLIIAFGLVLLTTGCATTPPSNDYTQFRQADPRSILVVPVVNRSVDINAPDYFLSTITRPVAERGYYVFPVNLTKHLLEDDGLSDADLVHEADPKRVAELFGADSVLYITIDRWDAKYVLLSTTVTVKFNYSLKSAKTGEEIWHSSETMVYQPQNNSTGNPLGDLIAAAVSAAITKAAPNYIPLAQQANALAVARPHRGLPAGPHSAVYKKDMNLF